MSYAHILVPTDFSSLANEALAHALEEARLHGSALTLLHVMQHPDTVSYFPTGSTEIRGPLADEFGGTLPHAEAPTTGTVRRDYLDEALNQLRDLIPITFNGKSEVMVESGHPADVIVRSAKDYNIDLIVMGTHGRSGLQHLLMGSVAEKVVRLAPCSVMVVREK